MFKSVLRFTLPFILLLTGCAQHQTPPVSTSNRYARFFSIKHFENFSLLRIIRPYPGAKPQTYVLIPRNHQPSLPDSLKKYPIVPVPLKRIVATSVTHLEPLEMLGAGESVVGFPQTHYIVSNFYQRQIQKGKLVDIGNELMPDPETILALHPEALLVFSTGNDHKDFSLYHKAGIPIIYIAEWLETHPLGRTEWLRVFGALTGKQNLADSAFERIRSHYEHLHDSITLLLQNRKRPKVFRGGMFADKWYMAGGQSWAAKLIYDAGGDYVLGNNNETGSIAINFENALQYLVSADIWLDPGSWTSRHQILQALPQAKQAPFWINHKIFSVNLKTNERGQIIFFERSPMHPDWVLADLSHIFFSDTIHPEHLYFYAPLPD